MKSQKPKAKSQIEFLPPAFEERLEEKRIVLSHGAGGRKMHRLIENIFLKNFGNSVLKRLEDSAVLDIGQDLPKNGKLCFTTDSYVVQPLFFSGGDIGKLAVYGTINDLSVLGAKPLYLSVGFVLREGLPVSVLEKICASIARASRRAGVKVVTGDTKVIEGLPRAEEIGSPIRVAMTGVRERDAFTSLGMREPRGRNGDELYINTSGIGVRYPMVRLGGEFVRPGDLLLINGGIGEHEAAIAISRGDYQLKARLKSDCAPLHRMIQAVLRCGGVSLMRDPTRGGLATTLNEFAQVNGLGYVVEEELLPVSKGVKGVAELLGLDPLYMANEGKVVLVVRPKSAIKVLKVMRRFPSGRGARVIGKVVKEPAGVWLKTRLGSLRRLLMLEGEQLPRIC